MKRSSALAFLLLAGFCWLALSAPGAAQSFPHAQLARFDQATADSLPLILNGQATPILLDPGDEKTLGASVEAFAGDIEKVTGHRPQILSTLPSPAPLTLIVVGTVHSRLIAQLGAEQHLPLAQIAGKWESAATSVVNTPLPGVQRALVVAGSDRRGASFALFELSRQMGVSPWTWWADVPVAHHDNVYVVAHDEIQAEPSVQYRGIFLNDEDWGLRPWAAKKMDPAQGNFGPHTYERIFELLLRLHANSLWPAMHPKTLPFNAVAENAQLADRWGIVMGASHSEALLRNNVGEWDEKRDGPWNYQTNRAAIDAYWRHRLEVNGKFENFYTVGMRGVHDTGLEATGTPEEKARLVEQVMDSQRAMLREHVNADLGHVPQVIWLYKESLELYRAGMKVPDDVTLGWTDDNYGYIRQLPTVEEQKRAGGSAVYYHVSYWGFPHDYLWLCSTPPALIREELTKAYDHNARKYWVLNVGDIKPAEADIDYFLQLAWNEPAMARIDQHSFFVSWYGEQFPTADAEALARVMDEYYRLNFIRRPEFMGFNGYNDGVRHSEFNPLAWGGSWGQNGTRVDEWTKLVAQEAALAKQIPASERSAYFELVGYPVEASAAQNRKFLFTDRSFVDAWKKRDTQQDAAEAGTAYQQIQTLTATYNQLENGKWEGMMSSTPREREVFKMPAAAKDATPLPASWQEDHAPEHRAVSGSGFVEERGAVSINAAHFARSYNGAAATWRIIPDLGLVETQSVTYGYPGALANRPTHEADQPWLEYEFTTTDSGAAKVALYLLPTFPVDAAHRLRFSVTVDGAAPQLLDLAGAGEWKEDSAPMWEKNVLRNAAVFTLPVNIDKPGKHTVRITETDPGLIFEHLVVSFPGSAAAYPFPPATTKQ